MSDLRCEIIETHPEVDSVVIWLHGLGASGNDFVPIIPELRLPEEYRIRFIFPHAPAIPVTVNGGMVMPAWYDIYELSIERKIDHKQIDQSAISISHLIDKQLEKGIASERVILAGFSQGGAVAYHTALSYPKRLGALLAMSTYFATHETIKYSEANRSLPIHLFHGQYDDVVPESLGHLAIERLRAEGFKPSYSQYPIDHSVHPAEVRDISNYLQKYLVSKA